MSKGDELKSKTLRIFGIGSEDAEKSINNIRIDLNYLIEVLKGSDPSKLIDKYVERYIETDKVKKEKLKSEILESFEVDSFYFGRVDNLLDYLITENLPSRIEEPDSADDIINDLEKLGLISDEGEEAKKLISEALRELFRKINEEVIPQWKKLKEIVKANDSIKDLTTSVGLRAIYQKEIEFGKELDENDNIECEGVVPVANLKISLRDKSSDDVFVTCDEADIKNIISKLNYTLEEMKELEKFLSLK